MTLVEYIKEEIMYLDKFDVDAKEFKYHYGLLKLLVELNNFREDNK